MTWATEGVMMMDDDEDERLLPSKRGVEVAMREDDMQKGQESQRSADETVLYL